MWPNIRNGSYGLIAVVTLSILSLVGCASDSESNDNPNPEEIPEFIPDPAADRDCLMNGSIPSSSFSWLDVPILENDDAALLSMEATQSFVSPLDIYDQTRMDLAAIRSRYADDELTKMQASACWSSDSIFVYFDAMTFNDVQSGAYDDWSELNNQFGGEIDSVFPSNNAVTLKFQRNYYIPTLLQIYNERQLNGVTEVFFNGFVSVESDICLELGERNRYYIFWRGSGDCPAGCINHEYSAYAIDNSGNIFQLGTLTNTSGDTSEKPEWVQQRSACIGFLQYSSISDVFF